MDRLRKCRRVPASTGQPVQIVRLGDAAYLGAVQTCGSVWCCPLCSEKILRARRDELELAVTRWAERGGRAAMVTLTMRHRRGQPLGHLWDGLQGAWSAARSHKTARRLLKGLMWVRRVEVTVGENGWHVHAHVLLFAPGDSDTLHALARAMFAGWASYLAKKGYDAPLRDSGGLDARYLDLDTARRELAGYLAKGTYDAVAGAGTVAAELTSSGAKSARGSNRTPMQLLADCVAHGLADDVALWWEWERSSKGRRALTWSRGARAELLGDDEAPTDDELASLDRVEGQVVALVPATTWASVCRAGDVVDVLEIAEQHDDLLDAGRAVVAWLEAHHGAAWIPPNLPARQDSQVTANPGAPDSAPGTADLPAVGPAR